MHHHRLRRGASALLIVLALTGASCSRSDDETEAGGSATTVAGGATDTTAAGAEGNRLDAAGFGDLEDVCQDGEGGDPGAGEPGIDADSIQIGTLTDKGFSFRPGLDEEMYDAAVAFAAWCNEHGGINGRELVVADRDAAYSEFNTQITAACSEDFALVGGGAVQDETDNGAREACNLPNIPGFVVSATARTAGQQVQPLPNPLDRFNAGQYARIAELHPDLINRYGLMTSPIQSTLLVAETSRQAATVNGYTEVFYREYNPAGIDPATARSLVDEMQAADVQILEVVGEPVNLGALQEAMDLVGYHPQITIESANLYDQNYLTTSGDVAGGTLIRTQFTPFELADDNPATADYLELMERYNPDGKIALLGAQAISSLLLFARSAAACGVELTRACLLEEAGSVTEWTGGGLHATQDPSAGSPSPCFTLLEVTPDAFVVDEETTGPTDGIFNCDESNIIDVDAG
jgi:hypothetical protein